MDSVSAIDVPVVWSEGQKAALLNLLTDDDTGVYRVVKHKLVASGPACVEWLKPHLLSRDPVLRRRVQNIVTYFEAQAADNRFLAFCLRHGEDFDLEEGAWLLARTRYPDINIEAYRALLDSFGAELKGRVKASSPAKEVLGALNQCLFDKLGFRGNEQEYYDPENSYLNRVVDRRAGNPISLCCLYLLLGRRLRLPLAGIGLPGHFVCRYQSASVEFYIDVFHRGKLLTKADCIQYLLNANFTVREDYLSPVTPRRLLLRICANLHQIYLQADDEEKATRVQRYLVALGR
jgi:regulator of sirC expression with transglutaminase-like and TPR domain